jgi:hypothetical protein
MTAMRAAGHDTTVKIQSLLIRRACRTRNHLMPRSPSSGRLAGH